ncbi:MAG: O-antigen ligase family protein [Flavobacteriaceae bacterium]
MFRGAKIIEKADENKSLIWGLFLSSQILGHAIGNIFLVVLTVLFIITVVVNRKIVFKKSLLPLLVLFFWGAMSVLWTTNLSETLSGIGIAIGLFAIPLIISQQSDFTLKELQKTIGVFSIFLAIYFFVSLCKSAFLFFGDGQTHHFFYHNLVTLFSNNAIYISLFTSICIVIKINAPNKTLFDWIIISALILFLLLLASKNLLISTFLLLGLSFVFFKKQKNIPSKSVWATFGIVLLTLISFFVFDNPVKQRFLDETDIKIEEVWNRQDFSDFEFNGTNLRIFQWRIASEMIENDQIDFLGMGLSNVNYLTEQYFNYYNVYQGYMPVNFHNQYLQTFGELGFVGLGILVFIFFLSVYKALKSKNKFLFLITLLFAICFLTESYLNRQKGIMFFSAIYSLWHCYQNTKGNNNSAHSCIYKH